MTGVKKPEDLTLDEVREQIALYQRLYCMDNMAVIKPNKVEE